MPVLTAISITGNTDNLLSHNAPSSRQTQPSLTDAASNLEAQLEKSEKARAALSQLTRNPADSVKAYARKRLEELEDMLHALALFGLPPEVIKAIAQELKGLVHEYQSAGETPGADTASLVQGDGATSGAAAINGDTGTSGVSPDSGEMPAGNAAPDTPDTTASADSPRNAASAYLDIARSTAAKGDAAAADADFLSRAKALIAQLEAMMKRRDQSHRLTAFDAMANVKRLHIARIG